MTDRLARGLLLASLALSAPAMAGQGNVGGYLRVGTRPDFQGGGGKLGYWNLYGRLLNEGPWAMLDMRLYLLEQESGSDEPWTLVHGRIEGGSVANADPNNGSLLSFRLAQLYVQAGNVGLRNVTWQVGTLEYWLGDLGLYDMRPATLFYETLGASAHYADDRFDVVLGVGDSGYALKRWRYNTVLTAGGSVRFRPVKGFEAGVGGQYLYEPKVAGNRNAAHVTPGVDYEDYVRGEVVQSWLADHPGQALNFPNPEPTDANSWKVVGYLGFGGWGPLRWNSTYASYQQLHPETSTTETWEGQDYDIYVKELTDQRRVLTIGNEMQLRLVPDRLDAVWSTLYGLHTDGDNTISPSDHARAYASTVLRLQTYITPRVHILLENSLAWEHSTNGNAFRNHLDSIFESSEGYADSRGLEYGDSDTRRTWQGKGGVVLNPLGPGVYVRPSLRLLYGVQYSTQNNAFGNSFVETLDQYDDFGAVERHWHHLVALETEAWF